MVKQGALLALTDRDGEPAFVRLGEILGQEWSTGWRSGARSAEAHGQGRDGGHLAGATAATLRARRAMPRE
jgi:hypothetical protein